MQKIIIIVIFATILSGCATGAKSYKHASLPIDESCEVFVFRDVFVLVWSLSVESEGNEYASLSDNTYASFQLPAGQREIKFTWGFGSGGVPLTVPLKCVATETVNISVRGSYSGNTRTIVANIISDDSAETRKVTHQKAE
ncbi:MAG: hypothetical protein ACC657_17295 [Thiohalomonadales bacterium]